MALLLWSGGCDSTLLLHDLLSAQRTEPNENGMRCARYVAIKRNDWVRAISVNHVQCLASTEGKKYRDRLAPLLKKRFKNDFIHSEVQINQDGNLGVVPGEHLTQPALWLLTAALYLDRDEDLYAGYIRGDDVWHHREALVASFQWLQSLMGKTGQLCLPLEWISKAEVIYRLKEAGLYRHVWYCEQSQKEKRCGKCVPCRTHQTALWQIRSGLWEPVASNP